MIELQAVCAFLEEFAPARLAEDWDNVGLLVGDSRQQVQRIMTCLTIMPTTVEEAVREQANLIVTHHPLPFRPVRRLTSEHTTGRLLLQLIGARIGVYSPHTAFDSAATGINQQLARGLGLLDIAPLVPAADALPGLGAGRQGLLPHPTRLAEIATGLKAFLAVGGLHLVGPSHREVRRVAVACGSAGQFLEAARGAGCELLITGETNFHTCLEAEATDVALLLPGHFASERFAVLSLASVLQQRFPGLLVWASRQERDPLRWI